MIQFYIDVHWLSFMKSTSGNDHWMATTPGHLPLNVGPSNDCYLLHVLFMCNN